MAVIQRVTLNPHKFKPLRILFHVAEELELLGIPAYEMAKKNLDMLDALMEEVQDFYDNWEKRMDEIVDKHEMQLRLQAKMKNLEEKATEKSSYENELYMSRWVVSLSHSSIITVSMFLHCSTLLHTRSWAIMLKVVHLLRRLILFKLAVRLRISSMERHL